VLGFGGVKKTQIRVKWKEHLKRGEYEHKGKKRGKPLINTLNLFIYRVSLI